MYGKWVEVGFFEVLKVLFSRDCFKEDVKCFFDVVCDVVVFFVDVFIFVLVFEFVIWVLISFEFFEYFFSCDKVVVCLSSYFENGILKFWSVGFLMKNFFFFDVFFCYDV